MKLLLQHKIFIGYFLLMAIIGSMVAIVLHERSRVQKIENESIAIFQPRHNINTTHRYVTTLVIYGESVMVWNDEDSMTYRERLVRTDSMPQTLRTQCKDFIHPEQIDSLCTLLATKEDHLFQIMEAAREQKKTDSLLFHQKPTVTTQTTMRTVTRKKKGIAGFFGGKETVQMPVVTTRQTAPVAARGETTARVTAECSLADCQFGHLFQTVQVFMHGLGYHVAVFAKEQFKVIVKILVEAAQRDIIHTFLILDESGKLYDLK